jgi:E3 ubiquitin-protein ligase EDD1
MLLNICLIAERERDLDRDRERDSLFRIRERTRWLDSALREESSLSRLDPDRADGLVNVESKKQSSPNPLSFSEDLQYWVDKVMLCSKLYFIKLSLALILSVTQSQ